MSSQRSNRCGRGGLWRISCHTVQHSDFLFLSETWMRANWWHPESLPLGRYLDDLLPCLAPHTHFLIVKESERKILKWRKQLVKISFQSLPPSVLGKRHFPWSDSTLLFHGEETGRLVPGRLLDWRSMGQRTKGAGHREHILSSMLAVVAEVLSWMLNGVSYLSILTVNEILYL